MANFPNSIALATSAALALIGPVPALAQDLSGFVQVDYVHSQESSDQLDDGDGQPLNEDGFVIRRARLRVADRVKFIEYAVEADFNTVEGPQAGFRELEIAVVGDAPASWKLGFPLVGRVGAGVFRTPFGYEIYEQRDTERLFAERALLSDAFVPGQFDLGARASLTAPFAHLVFAVTNGQPIASGAFPGRDPNQAKDLTGRLALMGTLGQVEISGGAAATWGKGFHPGQAPTKDDVVWRDLNEDGIVQLGELVAVPGTAGSPSEDFTRWGAEVDLQVAVPIPSVGRLRLYGEVALAQNLDRAVRPADPVLLGRDQRTLGGYLALTQDIRDLSTLGVRVDWYRPEIDATDLENGTIARSKQRFLSVAAAASFLVTVADVKSRLILDYTHRRDPLGRDDSGRPADLANDFLTVRAEVAF